MRFGEMVARRSKDPARCVRECAQFMERYGHVSCTTKITLEQMSWFAAVMNLGLQEAKKEVEVQKKSNVVTIVATDSVEARDSAT